MPNIKMPKIGKTNHSDRCRYPPIKLTIMANSVASKIPVILCRILPLTSLGDASMAPTVMAIPISSASSFTPATMGRVSAIPKRMALEKSVLFTNSERSFSEVATMFFGSFKSSWFQKLQRYCAQKRSSLIFSEM